MGELFASERWAVAANADAEFALAARSWDARMRIDAGDEHYLIEIQQGVIVRAERLPPDADGESWTFAISAPVEDWHAFLEPVPRPFYQDLMAASFRHGCVIDGDPVRIYPYYPALSRLLEIARELRAGDGKAR